MLLFSNINYDKEKSSKKINTKVHFFQWNSKKSQVVCAGVQLYMKVGMYLHIQTILLATQCFTNVERPTACTNTHTYPKHISAEWLTVCLEKASGTGKTMLIFPPNEKFPSTEQSPVLLGYETQRVWSCNYKNCKSFLNDQRITFCNKVISFFGWVCVYVWGGFVCLFLNAL